MKFRSIARSPIARNIGVGPQTNSSGSSSRGSSNQGSIASVTNPFIPNEPSFVVGRTSHPKASNSFTHRISSAVRPPKNAIPLRLSERALR